MQIRLLGPMLGIALMIAAVVASAQSTPGNTANRVAEGPSSSGVRTVATVMQLMHAIVIPSSDAVFKAAGEPPSTDAGWTDVQLQSLALAEAGNLLMIGSRPVDQADWMAMSRAMVDAAAEAAAAATAKDGDALFAAGDQVYETCETCHAKYLKK